MLFQESCPSSPLPIHTHTQPPSQPFPAKHHAPFIGITDGEMSLRTPLPNVKLYHYLPWNNIFPTKCPCGRAEGGGGKGKGGGGRWFWIADQLRSYLNQGCTRLILVDRACVEGELYNLHFCSFIRLGQRTNELSPTTVSLVFIFFRKLLDRRSVLAEGQRWREGFAWCLFIYLFSWRCRDQLCACADVSVCVRVCPCPRWKATHAVLEEEKLRATCVIRAMLPLEWLGWWEGNAEASLARRPKTK